LTDSLREIAILKKLSHLNVIKLYEIMYDDEGGKIYLVMEFCGKGPILKYDEFTGEFSINENFTNDKKKKFYYSEEELRDIIRGIVSGLDYLHHNNIVHRDIKPDNLLFDSNHHNTITDFNVNALLDDIEDNQSAKKVEGTMYFMAPECCHEEAKEFAGKPLDIWALGVLTYLLTYLEMPFRPENPENIIELLDMISNGVINFPEKRFVSEEYLDFMSHMLEKDPFNRMTIQQIKKHPWINKNREVIPTDESEKITISEDEVKKALNFFTSMQMAKKCGVLWKKKSTIGRASLLSANSLNSNKSNDEPRSSVSTSFGQSS